MMNEQNQLVEINNSNPNAGYSVLVIKAEEGIDVFCLTGSWPRVCLSAFISLTAKAQSTSSLL